MKYCGAIAKQIPKTKTHRTVSVYRVLQMRGGGYADVLPVLQVSDNKADVVPCERLHHQEASVPLPSSLKAFSPSLLPKATTISPPLII